MPPAAHSATRDPRTQRRPTKVSRTDLNFLVDTCLLLNFLALITVAVIVQFLFPSPQQASGWTLWGWGLDQWLQLQFGLVAALALGVLLHLMLHWTWVCGVVAGWLPRTSEGKKRIPDDGTRTIAGVGMMILVLNVVGLLIAAAALSIQRPA